jgi:hypothetical protein
MVDRYLYSLPVGDEPEHHITFKLGGHRRRGVFHPSDLCKEDQCKRYLAYELYAAPQNNAKVDARLRRIFDNGHAVHARLQHVMTEAAKAEGGAFYPEVGLPPNDLRIAGTTDGLLILKWAYFTEIKSMNMADFKDLGARPWPDHQRQVNIYMGLSPQALGAQVTAANIVVECKNNQDAREYFVRFDPKMWAESQALAKNVLEVAQAGELPAQITEKQGCGLKRCKFYDICKGPRASWRPDGPLVPLTKR